MAALSFASVIVLVIAGYIAALDLGGTARTAFFAAIALGAIVAAVVVNQVSTAAGRLPHAAKLAREARHRAAFAGVLGGALLLELYAAASDLNSWAEWAVLAGLALTAVGAAIAVQTRLR